MAMYLRILYWRKEILKIVSKKTNLKTFLKGIFLIGYFHLLKIFFLLPLIVANYSVFVNFNELILIDILIISIYSFFNEILYFNEFEMREEICIGLILVAIGIPLAI